MHDIDADFWTIPIQERGIKPLWGDHQAKDLPRFSKPSAVKWLMDHGFEKGARLNDEEFWFHNKGCILKLDHRQDGKEEKIINVRMWLQGELPIHRSLPVLENEFGFRFLKSKEIKEKPLVHNMYWINGMGGYFFESDIAGVFSVSNVLNQSQSYLRLKPLKDWEISAEFLAQSKHWHKFILHHAKECPNAIRPFEHSQGLRQALSKALKENASSYEQGFSQALIQWEKDFSDPHSDFKDEKDTHKLALGSFLINQSWVPKNLYPKTLRFFEQCSVEYFEKMMPLENQKFENFFHQICMSLVYHQNDDEIGLVDKIEYLDQVLACVSKKTDPKSWPVVGWNIHTPKEDFTFLDHMFIGIQAKKNVQLEGIIKGLEMYIKIRQHQDASPFESYQSILGFVSKSLPHTGQDDEVLLTKTQSYVLQKLAELERQDLHQGTSEVSRSSPRSRF